MQLYILITRVFLNKKNLASKVEESSETSAS